jgi:DNA-binding CsgD family transcriptional regulator
MQRGGHAAAAAALARAADLTAEREPRARRLASAADEAWLAGDADRALGLVDRVDTDDLAVRATASQVHGLIAGQRGSSTESFDWFVRAARDGCCAAPRLALRSAIWAVLAAFDTGRMERLTELREVATLIEATTADEHAAAELLNATIAFAAEDYDAAMAAFAGVIEAGHGSTDVTTLRMAAWALVFQGRFNDGMVLLRRAEWIDRSSGAVAALAALMPQLAGTALGTSHLAAEAAATEGIELARQTGQTTELANCLSLLARVDAVRGREEPCRAHAGEALELAQAHELLLAATHAEFALALLDLGAARHEEALARLKRILSEGHVTTRVGFVDELVEAAVRAGRPDEALEPLALWERFMSGRGVLIGELVLARGRALLAVPDDADAAFGACLALDARAAWPFYQARTELSYGEFLRRGRRKTEAREQLRAAYEGFQRIGAAAWADRAASELRATGETARKRDASTIDDLTPQELQIARLVAEGGRNREIAGQLFLSPKTVEYHLRKVFQKLDISSRTELVKLFAGGAAPRELVGA